jgi:hypothetical protein
VFATVKMRKFCIAYCEIVAVKAIMSLKINDSFKPVFYKNYATQIDTRKKYGRTFKIYEYYTINRSTLLQLIVQRNDISHLLNELDSKMLSTENVHWFICGDAWFENNYPIYRDNFIALFVYMAKHGIVISDKTKIVLEKTDLIDILKII